MNEQGNPHGSMANQRPTTPGPQPGGPTPPPPPPGMMPHAYPPPPPQKSASVGVLQRVATYFLAAILIVSLLLNLYLGIFFVSSVQGEARSVYQTGSSSDEIVIVPVEGLIDEDMYDFVSKEFRKLEKNPPSAVILRIDSGGGAVGACDRITNAIEHFRTATKEANDGNGVPVIASYGSVSASGGYYISANSDYIMAEPVCITGSIGVIASAFTVDEMLQKIGVTPETLVADGSPHKDVANNIMRPWTDADRDKLKTVLNSAHARFLEVVKQGFDHRFADEKENRPTDEQIEAIANGDIYTSSQALEIKLIDGEGYLDDAIVKAAELAGIEDATKARVTRVKRMQGLAALLGVSADQVKPSMSDVVGNIDGRTVTRWIQEMATPRLEYRFDLLQP